MIETPPGKSPAPNEAGQIAWLERRNLALSAEIAGLRRESGAQATKEGSWSFDVAADRLDLSDHDRVMFGVRAGETATLAGFFAGLHPDDREAVQDLAAAPMDPARRENFEIEFRVIDRQDGIIRWLVAQGRGRFDGSRCTHLLGTAVNVTGRRLAGSRQAFLLDLLDQLRILVEPGTILQTAARKLGRELDVSRVGFGLVQSDDLTILLEDGHCENVRGLAGIYEMMSFGTYNITRLRQGLTVVSDDVLAEPSNYPEVWAAIDARSFVSVPLLRAGRLSATFHLSDGPRCLDVGRGLAAVAISFAFARRSPPSSASSTTRSAN